MGYLTVTCREGEQIRLTIDPAVDTEVLLHKLLRDGITIHIGELGGSQIRVGIDAPPQVLISRADLMGIAGESDNY